MCNVSRCVFYSLEIQRNYVNQADPRTEGRTGVEKETKVCLVVVAVI